MHVCLDIGGSFIKAAYVGRDGRVIEAGVLPTPVDDLDLFVAGIRQLFADIPKTEPAPSLLAVSLAGMVEPESGRLIAANIACLHGQDVRSLLSAAFGIPVIVANDAACFTLAEARLGAGRGHGVVFGVILGTGVGGAVALGGALPDMLLSGAGEWGHGNAANRLPRALGGRALPALPCGCGRSGCLEAVGGARGLERLHAALTGLARTSVQITAAWERHEPEVNDTMACYVELVGGGIAAIVNLLGAQIVPVGGGLASVPRLIEALDREVREHVLLHRQRPLVVKARCAKNPGLVGASLLRVAAPTGIC